MQSPQYSSSIFLFDLRCFIETLHSMEQSKHRKRTETHTHIHMKEAHTAGCVKINGTNVPIFRRVHV